LRWEKITKIANFFHEKIVEKKSNKRLHFPIKCDRLLCGIPNIVSRGGGKPPSGKFQGG
jgi:hypothetical protein